MNIGLLSALEAFRLLRRNPIKYARGVGGMYLLAIYGWEMSQIGRAAFFFFRNIDDALDGDRKDIKNPLAHVLSCREQILSGKYTGKPQIVNLAKFAVDRLQRKARKGDNPKQDFARGIDGMLFDYDRAKERRVLTAKELKNCYKDTFNPFVNLMLIGINSKLRAKDIEEFSFCQARIYSIRDLDTDWGRGLINIPKEVLKKAKITPDVPVSKVRSSPVIKRWLKQELKLCQKQLPILENKLTDANESLTTQMCMWLINPLYRLSKQYLS